MAKFQVRKVSDNGNEGFSKTIKYYVMHQANVSVNHNKYYCAECQAHPDGRFRIFTHYGRLGITNIYEVRDLADGSPVYDEQTAMDELEHIHKKKLSGKSAIDPDTGQKVREAYVDVDVVSPQVGSVNIRGVAEVKKTVSVKAAIDTSAYSPQVSRLLDQLIQENIHAITTQSSVVYSAVSGFSTPLGSVTKDYCEKAKIYLDQLNSIMGINGILDPENPEVMRVQSAYFSYIPHKFGRKISSEDMVTDANKLQAEYDLIDQLSTAVDMGKSLSGDTKHRMSALGTDVTVLNDSEKIKRIVEYIRNSKAHNHRHEDVWNFDVRTVYQILIPEERRKFEAYGKKIGNIKELMHGSGNCNILSLLKTGMKQTSISAPGVSGKMFGELGLYFSDMSTKSLRYSLGYWGSKRSKFDNAFLFFSDVALGKTYEMRSGSYNYKGAKPGFHSTSAYAYQGFLYNNEYITYRTDQNTLTYLIEMTPYGK